MHATQNHVDTEILATQNFLQPKHNVAQYLSSERRCQLGDLLIVRQIAHNLGQQQRHQRRQAIVERAARKRPHHRPGHLRPMSDPEKNKSQK
jgi:hypothetical protein